jgi:hypothetical protein
MVASLTEPQLLQVLEPPAIAALHLGQVLCIFACDLLESRLEIQGQIYLKMARSCFCLLCFCVVWACFA